MAKVLKLRFFILTLWLGVLLCADLLVAPKLFVVIRDFFNAGELAITLFKNINLMELLFSFVLVLTSLRTKRFFILIVVVMPLISFFYLLPEMERITSLWRASEMNSVYLPPIPEDLQQAHQSLHRFMIGGEIIKIALLAIILFFDMRQPCKD